MIAADLRATGALARRSLTQTFRYPRYLAPLVVFPSLFLAVNVGGAGRATELPGFPEVNGFLDFELAAAMLQATMLTGVSTGMALGMDIERGFIDRLIAAPVARSVVVTGRLAATAALGIFIGVWFLTVGLVFGATVEGGVVGVLQMMLLLALAAVSFGALGSSLALRSGNASAVQGTFPLVFVILFLSSAFFPEKLMQQPAETIAAWNPLSLIAEGLREPVIEGASLASLGQGLAGIAIVGAISALLAAAALRHRLREG
ncbi:MAG: ABC transporter permease [Actinomycetota bacterium]|nr:ABC transporter permease [Actinomycetota bacterium]